jgi:hypothetical protein
MTQGRFAAIAVAAVVLAFGVAFAAGKATGGGGDKAAAPSAVTPVEVAGGPEVASFSPTGSLPAPKETKQESSGGGGSPAPSAPSEPAPSAPAPAPAAPAPAPSAPAPAPAAPAPPSGGSGGGGGGGAPSGGS